MDGMSPVCSTDKVWWIDGKQLDFPAPPVGEHTALAAPVAARASRGSKLERPLRWSPDQGPLRRGPSARPDGEAPASKRLHPVRRTLGNGLHSSGVRGAGEGVMCVWDGTYTAPEAEREAMDQIPGWNDETAPVGERRHASASVSPRELRRARSSLIAPLPHLAGDDARIAA